MGWFSDVLKVAVNPIGAATAVVAVKIADAVGADQKVQDIVNVVANPGGVVAGVAAGNVTNAADAGIDLVENQVAIFKAQIDLVKAIFRADPGAMKDAASGWISAQAGSLGSYAAIGAALTPRLANLVPALRELYMDDPAVEVINPSGFGGDFVYYVNGMDTNHEAAVTTARLLNVKLLRPIGLLHNDTIGIAGDLSECCYDRVWPNLNMTSLVAQANPATRRLTSLLYNATSRISVITHSQGCLIMRNALLTADGFTHGDTASKVA